MASKSSQTWLTSEVADFFASGPSPEDILAYRPSARVTKRLTFLLAKSKSGAQTDDEQWEMDPFEHIEILIQSIKAKLRPAQPVRV